MLLQSVADTAAVVSGVPLSAPLGWLASTAIGAAAALGTKVVSKGLDGIDSAVGNVDAKIRKGLGPALPIVTLALAGALPALSNALHLTNLPTPEVIATAPLSAVLGITIREIGRRWILPRLGIGGGK